MEARPVQHRARIAYLAAATLIAVVAAGVRVPGLEARPMHGDEANQAIRAWQLHDTGVYRYDPHEHHGPTLYYAALVPMALAGTTTADALQAWHVRVVPVAFGVAVVLVLLAMPGLLTAPGALAAAALYALSPAAIYYSRYFIQETLFVFFMLAMLAAAGRYAQRPALGSAVVFGIALGFAHATKETVVLVLAAGGVAVVVAGGLAWWRDGWRPHAQLTRHLAYGAAAFAVAGLASVAWFSNGFTYWRGPLDSVLTYATYLGRAEGTGSVAPHEWPWHYYLRLLLYHHREAGPVWSEWPIVLGGAGALVWLLTAPLRGEARRHAWRFLAVFALVLTALYSAIGYKTPWNLLPFHLALVLCAGLAWGRLLRARARGLRIAAAMVFTLGAAHLAYVGYMTNARYAADTRNPYVYAHTSSALERAVTRVNDLAALRARPLRIAVVTPGGDYWPLPWYLRGYAQVGYFVQPGLPHPGAWDVVLTHPEVAQAALSAPGTPLAFDQTYSLRPGVPLVVLVETELWQRFLATRG